MTHSRAAAAGGALDPAAGTHRDADGPDRVPYAYSDLLAAYDRAGVRAGGVAYVTSALHRVLDYEQRGARVLVEAHVRALRELLGARGTLVVPAWTWHLCNTDIAWHPEATPSRRAGAISEHVRRLDGARRSFHPFDSYCALGARAADVIDGVTRHQCGPDTPERRLVELDAVAVSVGLEPRITCSTVHQVEMAMGVPYRYTKEYLHPVHRGGTPRREPFYRFVWYRDMDLARDGNRKLFARLAQRMTIRSVALGDGIIASYSMADFFREAQHAFAEDIYIWCATPPTRRPYQT